MHRPAAIAAAADVHRAEVIEGGIYGFKWRGPIDAQKELRETGSQARHAASRGSGARVVQDEQGLGPRSIEVQRALGVQLPGVVDLKQLAVTIGGVTINMTSRECDIDLALRGPHQRFAGGNAQPDVTVEVVWERAEAVGAEKLFDSGGVWQLYREGELLSFRLHSPKFGCLPYARATFNPDFTSGVVHFRRDCFDASATLYPLEYPLDELLITNWLAHGRGVEVHACGIVDRDGAGYLFAGFSGAGKTTTARLWCHETGVSVLSDDRIILRKIGNDIWMHGTPWHGDEPLASPERAILRRGFFLHHATENHLTPVGGAQAVAELFSRTFPPFFSGRALASTLSVLEDITSVVPFAQLGFLPDERLPAFLRSP
jgi:hypothetical protein